MASNNKKKQIAQQFANLAERQTELSAEVNQAIKENAKFGINWGTANDHTAIVDEDGNIAGQNFSTADLANAIGSFQQFDNCANNVAVSQGDHLGNLTKLAEAN